MMPLPSFDQISGTLTMLNERLTATRPIAKSLKNAEQALNESVRNIGSLLVDIANAKDAKGTRFSLDAGVAASEKIALAAVSAIQSYQQMVAAHAHLAEDRDMAGLGAISYGDTYCPPKKGEAAMPPSNLRVVGD
jgi:hypothetical protein